VPRGRIRSTVLGALAALFATVALLVFREARRIDA